MSDEIAAVQESLVAAKKRGRKPKDTFKALKFDKDAVLLIQSGLNDVGAICKKLGVDAVDAGKRLDLLVEKGLLVRDSDVFRLSVEGYNKLGVKKVRVIEPKVKAEKFVEPIPVEKVPDEVSDHIKEMRAMLSQDMDLGELLRKGAPHAVQGERPSFVKSDVEITPAVRPRKAAAQRQMERKEEQKSVEKEVAAPKAVEQTSQASEEVCELCKAAFKLSVSNLEESKYGHCFCGAAYHKDCYDHQVESGGKCVRCGKKLSLLLSKGTEEAVNSVRDAFE